MATIYSPTREDVERYRHLRRLVTELTQEITSSVPARAWSEVGKALGILDSGAFDNKYVTNVLADCCIYDWFEDGKNLIQRFSETHPEQPGTDEHYVLDAYLRAAYRILVLKSAVPGAGIHCRDGRSQEELFLMDLNFSRNTDFSNVALAARLVPFGEYWITTGAALPIIGRDDLEDSLRRLDQLASILPGNFWDPVRIVRVCLAAGAADLIFHDDTGMKPRNRRRSVERTVDPTDLCPCRSGLMYKYCCGRAISAPASGA